MCVLWWQYYEFFGRFLGKVVLEGFVLNVRFSLPFLKHLLGTPFTLEDLRWLDTDIYRSLVWILENPNVHLLGLSFEIVSATSAASRVVFGRQKTTHMCFFFFQDGVELVAQGASMDLTDDNKDLYVKHALQYYLYESVDVELQAILTGLRAVLPDTLLHVFDYKELDLVLSGEDDVPSKLHILVVMRVSNACLLSRPAVD